MQDTRGALVCKTRGGQHLVCKTQGLPRWILVCKTQGPPVGITGVSGALPCEREGGLCVCKTHTGQGLSPPMLHNEVSFVFVCCFFVIVCCLPDSPFVLDVCHRTFPAQTCRKQCGLGPILLETQILDPRFHLVHNILCLG